MESLQVSTIGQPTQPILVPSLVICKPIYELLPEDRIRNMCKDVPQKRFGGPGGVMMSPGFGRRKTADIQSRPA